MQPLKLCLFLSCLFSSPFALANASCPSDSALLEAEFTIHPSEKFNKLAQEIVADFLDAGDDYIYDTAGPVTSRYGGRPQKQSLVLFSFDDVTTPQSEQYGDIVLVMVHDRQGHSKMADIRKVSSSYTPKANALNNRLVEVRWWDDGVRNVIYDKTQVRCAAHSLPMAINALL